MSLKITSVNIYLKENSRMKGLASVIIDDCFAVRDIRIIEGDNGLFVAMPSKKKADGEYKDIAHPITQECRKMFEDVILEAYNDLVTLNTQECMYQNMIKQLLQYDYSIHERTIRYWSCEGEDLENCFAITAFIRSVSDCE